MTGALGKIGAVLPMLACALFGWTGPVFGQTYGVPYFSAASDPTLQGFVRIFNRDDESGTVSIEAIDDAGERFGPLTLSIGAGETVHFNSDDLEEGNSSKGLLDGVGEGSGDWRLELASELELEVLAYLRTADGFLTAMHDVAPLDRNGYRVAMFNPGSNVNQVGELRLINSGIEEANVRIVGIDDGGALSQAETEVPAGASVTLTAQEIEALGLGDGKGKWQLRVESDAALRVLSLLRSPTGHLTNLSTAPASLAIDGAGKPVHRVALMPAAGGFVQGFVRVINHDAEPGTVEIDVIDDTGVRRGSLELGLEARETAHFNADDLRAGNTAKNLTGRVAEGQGEWRLEIRSSLAIEVFAYARTRDGFLTSLHDVSPMAGRDHHVGVFNPGSNRSQVSSLRLVNPGDDAVEVTIVGVDDEGETPGGEVSAVVPAQAAVTYTVRELEEGSGEGLLGSIGVGKGKWRLRVTSRQPVQVLSLMRSPTGHVTNLSTSPSPPPVRTVSVVADADIPPGADTVVEGEVRIATLGSDTAEVATGVTSSLLIASDGDGTLMLASADEDGGYVDEGSGAVEVGIESTAIALVAVASGRRFAEIDRELANFIRSHDDFERLTRMLTGLMAADKNYLDRLYDYPEAVTLIKSVAASVAAVTADETAAAGLAPASLVRKRASVANQETGPITARHKDDFYCVAGGIAGSFLTPCSPWYDHEPWRWYGDAEGVKAFFPDNHLDVVLSLVIPGYSLGEGYVELGLQAATDPPFLAVSESATRGCRGSGCGDDVHAMANPNYVNYAMELYEDGTYRDWYYTPRNASVINKLLNSGAAYRKLRADSPRIQLGPEIDSIRFQRYRFSLGEGDEGGVLDRGVAVSFMNTLHLVLVGVNLVSDVSVLQGYLRDAANLVQGMSSLAACAAEVKTRVAQADSGLVAAGELVLDTAEPDQEPKDRLWQVFTNVAPSFLLSLGHSECGEFLERLTTGRSVDLVELMLKAYAETAALATPYGWAKLVFDAANEAVPATVSYFAPGAARVDYHLSWEYNSQGTPYLSAVSKSRPPQARFEYARIGGFRLELDASTTTPGDSDELVFEWSVNGVVVGRGERFIHDFGSAGKHRVELTVTDGNGLAGTFASGVEVTPGSTPVVSSLECTAIGERRFRMVAAFSDVDGDIETVEWRSNANSEYPDEVTSADTTEVELTASRAMVWASVEVVDVEENRATKVCSVDVEQGPSKKIAIDSASAVCVREEPWRACYHRQSVGPNELVELALTMPRESAGSWHGAWCVKEEKQGLCLGQYERRIRIAKHFADDAPLTFFTRPHAGAETFWVVAEIRECGKEQCAWPDDFTEVEFHHVEVVVEEGLESAGTMRPGDRFSDCEGCPEMVVVPAGSFLMGSTEDVFRGLSQGPVHGVTIRRPFAVGVYEVTLSEWDMCYRNGGCSYDPGRRDRGNHPIGSARWADAKEYVRWLSRETGEDYRLLSESEWEYAARAGATTKYHWGNEVGVSRANCRTCGSEWDNRQTAPVGSFPPNAWGLQDMHGNVEEWTEDCSHDDYRGAPNDGSAWSYLWPERLADASSATCACRVVRGGSFRLHPRDILSTSRSGLCAFNQSVAATFGFRVARTLASTAGVQPVKGVLYSDDFESYAVGSSPEGHVVVRGRTDPRIDRIVEAEGENQHLFVSGGISRTHVRKDFGFDLPALVSLSWRMRSDYRNADAARKGRASLSIKNGDEFSAGIVLVRVGSDGSVVASCPEGDGSQPQVQRGVWTEFQVDVDFAAERQTMYADGKKFCDTATSLVDPHFWAFSWGNPSGILFTAGGPDTSSGDMHMYFDDIVVRGR